MSLPLLRSNFFKSQPLPTSLWGEWQPKWAWHAGLCPVYQWEQVLFVGCTSLETPEIQSYSESVNKIIFVLCEPEPLAEFFEKLSSQKLEAKIPIASPAATTVATTAVPHDDPFAGLIATDDLPSKPSVDSHLDLNEESAQETEENPSAPEGLDEIPESLSGLSLDLNPGIISLTPTSAAVIPPAIVAAAPAGVAVPAPAPPPNVGAAKTKAVEDFSIQVFQKMSGQFIKSMLFTKDGATLIPWKWDQEFAQHSPSKESSISLEQPSPFRIVSKTLKPYHGYVVSNEVSEKFFEDWNSSQIPDHLTLVPIVIEEQLVAVLLGIAEKEVNPKTSLVLAERLAAEVEVTMKSLLHPRAQAAS